MAKELHNRRLESLTLSNLGRVYWERGEPIKAMEHYKKALDIANDINDWRQQSVMWDCLGMVERQQRQFDDAVECHRKSAKLAKEHGYQREEARALDNLALALLRHGYDRKHAMR